MRDSAQARLVLLACFAAAGVALVGCGRSDAHAPSDAGAPVPVEPRGNGVFVPDGSPLRVRLTVEAVSTENLQHHLSAPATVEAEPTRMAKISPPLTGRIVKLFVHFGDAVKQGQPLFLLDSPELVSARSDFLKAKSAFSQGERNVARQKDLLDHGIGAQRDYEQAQTDRDTAKSELDRTTTRLRLLGNPSTNVEGPLTVVAPISGRIIDLTTSPGQFQNDPSAVLMILADLSTVWVTASVQEKDIRRVQQGDEATAAFAAYPGETFSGHVLFVGDLLDPETRSIKVRVAFKNDEARLKPGMFATVTFGSKAVAEVVVPTQAVVVSGEKSTVYVETAPWTFERRTIEVGEQFGGRTVVTKGLTAGTRIVVSNAVLLP